jgi:catechol 2,3-dioxygenase-like lactoylglutathione lyase family enzyme
MFEKVGPIFHLTHMSDDFWDLNRFYANVFGAVEFSQNHSDGQSFPTYVGEKRDAALIVVADACFEPMSPAFFLPGWEEAPIGRFYRRFGRHWHSIALYTDDIGDLYRHLKSRGLRIAFGGGAPDEGEPGYDEAIFTHPKETYGALEFKRGPDPHSGAPDPRFTRSYDPCWWTEGHGSGIQQLAYITVAVRDAEKAAEFYRGVLNGVVLERTESALTMTRNIYVSLGDHVVLEFAQPLDEGCPAALELVENGEMMHAIAFQVRDLDATQRYLESKGVATLTRDDTTLLSDPQTTFGAPFRFTTSSIHRI